MTTKTIQRSAAALAAIAVILGALGAHALKAQLGSEQLDSYKTGVLYHLLHAIALLALLGLNLLSEKGRSLVAKLWLSGIVCFSFSIYLLSTQDLHGLSVTWLGPITPIGGLLLIAGWVSLFINSK